MKKLVALFLGMALLFTSLAGCSQPAATASVPAASETNQDAAETAAATDKLVIWSYMNEGEPNAIWQQSVVDEYSEIYPDVDVEIVFCGREILTQFQTKLNDKDADDFPDIVSQMSGTMIPLAQEGMFISLNDAFATPALDQDMNWGDTFIPKLLESMEVDGQNYFVPEGMYTHGFFYDEVMFENLGIKVPETWDELMDACETLKAAGIAPVTLDGTTDVYNEWWFIRFATRLAGSEALDEAAQGQRCFQGQPRVPQGGAICCNIQRKRLFSEWIRRLRLPGRAGSVHAGQGGHAPLRCMDSDGDGKPDPGHYEDAHVHAAGTAGLSFSET